MKYTIGLDLGGTKLAAALVDENGKIISFTKVPVNMKGAGSALKAQKMVIQLIADVARDFKNRFPTECSNLKGIGLASAGPMNVEKGVLINPANYPGWKTFPLLKRVSDRIKTTGIKAPVSFQNDAIAAALAEGWIGGAKKMSSYAVVTVGTGIGTGLIINGKPCQTKGAGSEFGHLLVDITSLKNQPQKLTQFTVEGIASGTALIRRAKELGFKGHSVEELVLEKSTRYKVLFDDMSWALAMLCFNLSVGFNLDGIFLSGGLIKIQDRFFTKTVTSYKKLINQFNPMFESPIRIAKTKNQAGVVGAAYLPWQSETAPHE
jgi:glucokinase